MDKDRLINLIPEEYLPEPEFKAFPIFAAVLIIATLLLVWVNYQRDDAYVLKLKNQRDALVALNDKKVEEAKEFTLVQANARFLASYIAIIPDMVLAAPDYWEIYNEIERLLPEDTWVKSIVFKRGRGKWPDIVIECMSRGYSYSGPLLTYDRFKGTPEKPTRFTNIKMGGYQRKMIEGGPGVAFQISMGVRYPSSK